MATEEKLVYTVEEAAGVLGVSRDSVYSLILKLDPATRKPRLHSVKIGRRRIIPRIAIERFLGMAA